MQFLAELLAEWRKEGGGHLTIGIEEATAFGEALECYLSQAGFQIVVVSESKVAGFRKAIQTDANDLIDAEVVARLLMVQPDLARAPARQAAEGDPHGRSHRRLRQLSRRHARWTKEHTATCNELHAVLRMAWLADYQGFFSAIDGVAALAFWQRYPTPPEAAKVGPATIAALLRRASGKRISESTARQKAKQIHATAKLMVLNFGKRHPDRWTAWAEDIRLLARHLSGQAVALKQLEKQMEALLAKIHTPLTSFKGLGPVTAATIHGEMLSVDRFATANRFARYNGTAPRESSSGRSPCHVKNTRCNRRLKQVLMQLALNASKYHQASADYLEHLRARGITGGAARIRLARRLSDVIYAMLKENRPYDLNYHLEKKKRAA
jgi:transposase